RRISVHQDIMAFMEGSRHEEVQEELLESNWMIYRSSPLFGVPKTEEGFSDASSSLTAS
ncbi:Centromere protein L, partial [Caligus rogercresseyi]